MSLYITCTYRGLVHELVLYMYLFITLQKILKNTERIANKKVSEKSTDLAKSK